MPLNRLPLLAALLLAALPAKAQTPPAAAPPVDPNENLVEELVVVGRLPGPAWWRVVDADTTVYVLGVPSIAPRKMQWNRGVFERRLEGANAVVLPFVNVKAKAMSSVFLAFNLARLKSGGPFENRLDPATRDREFHGQPLIWAAEGSRSHADRAREYEEVGRLLLDAGSPVDWQLPTDEPAESVTEVLAEWQRRRAEAVR